MRYPSWRSGFGVATRSASASELGTLRLRSPVHSPRSARCPPQWFARFDSRIADGSIRPRCWCIRNAFFDPLRFCASTTDHGSGQAVARGSGRDRRGVFFMKKGQLKLFPEIGLCQEWETVSKRDGEKTLRSFLRIRHERMRMFLTCLSVSRLETLRGRSDVVVLLKRLSERIDGNIRAVPLKTIRMSINADKLDFVTPDFIKKVLGPNPTTPDRRTRSLFFDAALVFAEILRAEHGHLVWGTVRTRGGVEQNHVGLIPIDATGKRRDSEAFIPWVCVSNCAWRAFRNGEKTDLVALHRVWSRILTNTK